MRVFINIEIQSGNRQFLHNDNVTTPLIYHIKYRISYVRLQIKYQNTVQTIQRLQHSLLDTRFRVQNLYDIIQIYYKICTILKYI